MIKTFKYGLLAPTANAVLVRQEMYKAHLYQNKLIEIERWRRAEIRKIESQAGDIPALTQVVTEAQQALDVIIKRNSEAKKNAYLERAKNLGISLAALKNDETTNKAAQKRASKALTAEMKDELKQARSSLKIAVESVKLMRKNIRQDISIQEQIEVISDKANKLARATSNKDITPWYGTYMLVQDAFARTRKMPMYDGIMPNDPCFRSVFDERRGQRIGIQQFQPSQPSPREFISSTFNGTSHKLQIVSAPPVPLRKDGNLRRVGKKDLRLLRLRIGTDDNNKPIWAEFPMVYHRDLPLSGVITVVQVTKRRIGPRERWTVSITIDDQREDIPTSNSLTAGVDLNWFQYPDRVSVANWEGSDGSSGEISIPKSLLDRLHQPEVIKSIRDENFDAIRQTLITWLQNSGTQLPDWLKEKTVHLAKWRSQGKLASLIRYWQDNRFGGDQEIFGVSGQWDRGNRSVVKGSGLAGWLSNDTHLWNWEASSRSRSVAARNEYYRIEAAKLAEHFGAIGFEDLNLAHLARGNAGSTNRQLVGPSEFRAACKNAFRSRSKEYYEVPARNTSKNCNVCGHTNSIGMERIFTCQGCGIEIQRDPNAGKNVLDLTVKARSAPKNVVPCEQSSDVQNAGSARINDFEQLATVEPTSDECQEPSQDDRSQNVA